MHAVELRGTLQARTRMHRDVIMFFGVIFFVFNRTVLGRLVVHVRGYFPFNDCA